MLLMCMERYESTPDCLIVKRDVFDHWTVTFTE